MDQPLLHVALHCTHVGVLTAQTQSVFDINITRRGGVQGQV